MSKEDAVLTSIRDGVAELRFNRPERLNVLDTELANAFSNAAGAVLADGSVRVVVLSSSGRAFIAGGDLAHFHLAEDKSATAHELIDPLHAILLELAQSPKIVVAAVKGAVAGGGFSLAMSADLVIAADDAAFNLAYARIGASPDCGASWWLPRLVGTRKAMEIALLSDAIDAAEALRLGLVTRVVRLASLEAETSALAARLAAGAPEAQAAIKRLMRGSFEHSFDEQLDAEADAFAACAATTDFAEGINAFFEKRRPKFGASRGG